MRKPPPPTITEAEWLAMVGRTPRTATLADGSTITYSEYKIALAAGIASDARYADKRNKSEFSEEITPAMEDEGLWE